MNKLSMFFFSVLLLGFVSPMYAGSNFSFTVPTTDDLTWDAVGNSSNMEGFSVYQEINGSESIITFSAVINMKPDNFTIILSSNKTNEVIVEVPVYKSSSSGGHSHTNTITKYVNNTIIKEIPIENKTIEYITNKSNGIDIKEISTNKIPLWSWILIIIETCILIALIIIYLNRKSDDTRELKGGKKYEEN